MLARISKVCSGVAAFALVLFCSNPAMAQAAEVAQSSGELLGVKAMALLAAGLAIAIGTIGPALAQGNAIAKAMEAIGRNPGAADSIRTVLLIGLAFIESLCIYALVIAFMAIGYAA